MQYRAITADEVKDVARLMRLGFGDPVALTEHYAELLGIDGIRGLFDRDQMVATIDFFEDAHHFCGGAVSTWGVTGVGVDPRARGRGISGSLFTESIKEAASTGVAMMTLYASAPAAYRKMGYERGGKLLYYKAKTALLAASGTAKGSFDNIDPLATDTPALLAEIHRSWMPQTSGPFLRGEAIWKCLLQPYNRPTDVFIWRDETGQPGAYAILHHTEHKFRVTDICTPTGDAATAMLGFLGGFRAVHSDVTWTGALVDPLIMAMNDRWWETTRHEHWFSRIVNVQKALTQRGYPRGITCRLSLTVDDPILRQNTGSFAMEVAETKASVERIDTEDGSLRLTVQTLVPLFTGLVSASRLAAMGRIEGPKEAIETADLVFSGPTPWMEESF